MPIHFEAIAPRGIRIVCTEEQWSIHILPARKRSGWTEDDDWEASIIRALERPFMIAQDRDYEDRNVYYYMPGMPGENTMYFKVCVKFFVDHGEVITAFETNNAKSGEKVIWPI